MDMEVNFCLPPSKVRIPKACQGWDGLGHVGIKHSFVGPSFAVTNVTESSALVGPVSPKVRLLVGLLVQNRIKQTAMLANQKVYRATSDFAFCTLPDGPPALRSQNVKISIINQCRNVQMKVPWGEHGRQKNATWRG